MLVLPDTPQYANMNRGVWVFRIANGIPYYSNGVRWVANTGGLGPQTISDSLTAFQSRVVTSYNGFRGPVKGVDSIWFTNLGTVINWRYNGTNYNQLITGTGSVPDSNLFATVNYVNSNFATISALNSKLNISDTANKWVGSLFKSGDTLKYRIGSTIYTVGTFAGGGASLPSQSGNAGRYLTTNGTVASWGVITTTEVSEGSNLYFTNSRSRSAISLTTTGTGGAATYNSGTGVLNIPQYSGGTDSGAYRTSTKLSDSSFTINRANGTKDTFEIVVDGAGAGDDFYNSITVLNKQTIRFSKPNTTFTDVVFANDTTALASFTAGSRDASDTASFSTGSIYGAFYNGGVDTLVITSIVIGLRGTSPNITATVYYNDSLDVTAGATELIPGGTAATNTTTGTTQNPTNNKIPPNNWVWVTTPAVTTKPTFFNLTLIGYKK